MNDLDDAKEYLKVRLALTAALAAVLTTGVIGLIDVVTTASVDAMPIYVHVLVGASMLPVTFFLLDYRDIEEDVALRVALATATGAVVGVGLLAEGTDRFINDFAGIGAPTLFYAASIGLIAATLAVTWVQRRVIRPLAEAPARNRVPHHDRDR